MPGTERRWTKWVPRTLTPADISYDDLMKVVSREGQSIHIELRRMGRDYNVDLTLKRNFEYPPTWPMPTAKESGFLEFLERKEGVKESQ